MPTSYSSSSYYYSSATNTIDGTEKSGHRYTTSSHTDQDGNTIVRTAHQDLGAPAFIEERRYDRSGQEMLPSDDPEEAGGGQRRIADITDDEEYSFGMTTTGPASVDTSSLRDGVSSPVDEDAIGRYRGSVDEGDVDPMTRDRYSRRDMD